MSLNLIFANNVNTTLAAPITTTGATTLTLSSTTNAPSPTGGQNWVITLNDAATNGVFEIVYCTARSGAVCTIVRGQEGTAATTWLANDLAYGAGATAATLNNFALINGSSSQNFAAAAITMTGALSGGTTSSISGVGTAQSFAVTGAGSAVLQVGISNDGFATNGFVFNTITGSTNGFSWVVNGNITTPIATPCCWRLSKYRSHFSRQGNAVRIAHGWRPCRIAQRKHWRRPAWRLDHIGRHRLQHH